MAQRDSIAKGTMILAITGLIVKISGFMFRPPLKALIGTEGLGIYQMALPAFYALLAIAAGGIPVAITNLVAEYGASGRPDIAEKVLRLGLALTTALGAVGAGVMMFTAPWVSTKLGDSRAYPSLVAMAPGVYLFALVSCYRGYFQGRQLMSPNGWSNITEQAGRVVATLLLAWWLMPAGVSWGATGAALGMTVGAAVCLGHLVLVYRRDRFRGMAPRGDREHNFKLIGRMVKMALPVSVGNALIPLLSLLDVGIIQQGFQRAGHSVGEATAMYGSYSGLALPMIWFPATVIGALGSALLPAVTDAHTRGAKGVVFERIVQSLRATALIGLPCAAAMMILARPLMAAIFHEPEAAEPLLWAATVAFVGPLGSMAASGLQGLGLMGVPVRNFSLAMVGKLVLDFLLAGIPGMEMKGVALASVALNLGVAVVNLSRLQRELEQPLPWRQILLAPLVAASAMGVGVLMLLWPQLQVGGSWRTLAVALVLVPALYAVSLVLTRTVSWTEMRAWAAPVAPKLERFWQAIWPWA